MDFISMILHLYIISSIKVFHLNVYKHFPSNHNNLYSRNNIDHNNISISLIVYYHFLFCKYLLLFVTNNLVQNQALLSCLSISRVRYYLFLIFYFLMLIELYIFHHNHYLRKFYILLHKYKIFFFSIFQAIDKIYFFLCILESSCLRLFTLNPHEKQVHSYSYCRRVFRLQCLQFLAYFSLVWSSVNSIY